MNAQRRARIEKVENAIADLLTELDAIQQEEQEAFDNLPESLQSGEAGDKSQAAVDSLQTAQDDLENVQSTLEEARQ